MTECAFCGVEFAAVRSTARFCSAACRRRAHDAKSANAAPVIVIGSANPLGSVPAVVQAIEKLVETHPSASDADREIALRLAWALSEPQGGASLAMVARQLQSTIARIETNAPTGSQLDAIKARAAVKRARIA